MMAMRRLWGSVGVLFMALIGHAYASDYPIRPIELVVMSSGSASDIGARSIGAKMSEYLGQPVIVSVKPGAGGAISAGYVARAKPDGYTLSAATSSAMTAVPLTQKNIPYTMDSFDVLSGFGIGTLYFVVRADSPYKSIADLVAAARQRSKALTYASFGIGVTAHFASEWLWSEAGVELTYVPYKSSADSLTALLGGQVDLAVTANTAGIDRKAGARILAVSGARRHIRYPDIPTLVEQGYNVTFDYSLAFIAPKGLPEDVRARLMDALRKADAANGELFRTQLMAGDLVYSLIPAATVLESWKSDMELFRKLAPRMNLDK